MPIPHFVGLYLSVIRVSADSSCRLLQFVLWGDKYAKFEISLVYALETSLFNFLMEEKNETVDSSLICIY